MSRLIDADELKKTICGSCELLSEHLCSTEGDVKGCLAEMINNAPTVDAVQKEKQETAKSVNRVMIGTVCDYLIAEVTSNLTLSRFLELCEESEPGYVEFGVRILDSLLSPRADILITDDSIIPIKKRRYSEVEDV